MLAYYLNLNGSLFWTPCKKDDLEIHYKTTIFHYLSYNPRANGAKRRSGRKPGARVTNSARLFTPGGKRQHSGFKSGCHRRVGGHLTYLKKMDVY